MMKILWSYEDRPSWMRDTGWMFLRVIAGLSLALGHGMGKLPVSEDFVEGVGELGFPMPVVFAWGAALAESAGGILLALGLLTRPASLMILITMGVAVFLQHAEDPFGTKEKAILYGAIALAFLLVGSGRLGLDAMLGGGKKTAKPKE